MINFNAVTNTLVHFQSKTEDFMVLRIIELEKFRCDEKFPYRNIKFQKI